MSIWTRTRTAMAATCLAFAAIPGTIVLIHITRSRQRRRVCQRRQARFGGWVRQHRGRGRTVRSAACLLRADAL